MTINLSPEKTEVVVLAACALHNFLCKKTAVTYTPEGMLDSEILMPDYYEFISGSWRAENSHLLPLARHRGNRCSWNANQIQAEFMEYFNSAEGSVPWQWHAIS